MSAISVALLLAAGKGTRMRSSLPKPVVPFNGRPLIQSLIDQFWEAGVKDVFLIVGYGADTVQSMIGNTVRYFFQTEQKGTAHAVTQARALMALPGEHVFVFVGDSPLIQAETILKLEQHHIETGASCTFLTAHFPMDLPYARVVRNANGEVTACVEEKNADEAQLKIRELLSSHFIFKKKDLFDYLSEVKPDKDNGELYLTDMIGILLSKGLKVEALPIRDYTELVGLNTPEEIQWAEQLMKNKENV